MLIRTFFLNLFKIYNFCIHEKQDKRDIQAVGTIFLSDTKIFFFDLKIK